MAELPLLYHVPPSFYSQIARLGLVEKGVAFRSALAAAGPPIFETYEPWYMRLNPNGTVPTLVHGDDAVPDSREILDYVDAHFEGPRLRPEDPDERARMDAALERLYAISIRELSYGSGRLVKIGARMNQKRLATLRRHMQAQPDMRDIYEAKLHDIEGFAQHAQDSAHVDEVRGEAGVALDELDASLAERPFLAGSSYSLADVVWTVGVSRMIMLGMGPLTGRPQLGEWYARMQARPSFTRADVWNKVKPGRLLAMFVTKLWPYMLALLALLALLVAGLWWVLNA